MNRRKVNKTKNFNDLKIIFFFISNGFFSLNRWNNFGPYLQQYIVYMFSYIFIHRQYTWVRLLSRSKYTSAGEVLEEQGTKPLLSLHRTLSSSLSGSVHYTLNILQHQSLLPWQVPEKQYQIKTVLRTELTDKA